MNNSGNKSGSQSDVPKSLKAPSSISELSSFNSLTLLSGSNENCESLHTDDDKVYTPSEILDWETQNFNPDEVPADVVKSMYDDYEEEKSKSTSDGRSKVNSKYMLGNVIKSSTLYPIKLTLYNQIFIRI